MEAVTLEGVVPAEAHDGAARIDAARMARVAAGDERAFRDLYDRHQLRLHRLAHGVLIDRDEAREAVQEAFLALHRAAPTWRADASVGTWLYRVVLNHCLSLRARLLRLARPRGSRSAPSSPERAVVLGEAARIALRSLEALPMKQRAVAVLFLEAELSPSEIAPIVDATPNAVRVALHRALTTLRADLAAAGFEAIPTPDEPVVERYEEHP